MKWCKTTTLSHNKGVRRGRSNVNWWTWLKSIQGEKKTYYLLFCQTVPLQMFLKYVFMIHELVHMECSDDIFCHFSKTCLKIIWMQQMEWSLIKFIDKKLFSQRNFLEKIFFFFKKLFWRKSVFFRVDFGFLAMSVLGFKVRVDLLSFVLH